MTQPRLDYIEINLPPNATNIEGNYSHPFSNWNVLWVFVDGIVYNLVYETPTEQQVRYDRVIGQFWMPDVSDDNRKLTVIRKL